MSNNENNKRNESDELRIFRERWKREVQSRSSDQPTSSSSSSNAKVKSSKGKIAIPNSRDLVSRAQSSLSYQDTEKVESPPSTSPRFVNDSDVVLDPLVISINNLLLNPPPIEEGEQEEKTNEEIIEEENLFTFLDLPIEIQVYILSICSIQTLERSSQSCRKLFLLARDNSMPQFRRLCISTWRDCYEEILTYGKNWRRMFVNRPRVRLDGIYISKNRYLHVGLTEGAFNQPIHQVTYYRFLRFMPDGSVISALSAEEPKQVLGWFKPLSHAPSSTPSNRQVLKGIYEIDEGQIVIYLAPFSPTANYFYCLKLMLSSTHPGKNDRLNYVSYEHYTGQPTWIFQDNPHRGVLFGESSPFNVDIKRYQFVKVPQRYWDEEDAVDVSF